MSELAKSLIILGVILIAAGFFLMFEGKIPGLGKLPGDIYLRKGNFTFYFPFMTGLVLSLLLTILFNLFGKK